MKTWTIKIETKLGAVKLVKFKASGLGEAITICCQECSVGNILAVWQGQVRWL